MRAGREEDYHGVAVHPRHLSRYERHVLKCGSPGWHERVAAVPLPHASRARKMWQALPLHSWQPGVRCPVHMLARADGRLCTRCAAANVIAVWRITYGLCAHGPQIARTPLHVVQAVHLCDVCVPFPQCPLPTGSTISTTRSWIWRSAAKPNWRPGRTDPLIARSVPVIRPQTAGMAGLFPKRFLQMRLQTRSELCCLLDFRQRQPRARGGRGVQGSGNEQHICAGGSAPGSRRHHSLQTAMLIIKQQFSLGRSHSFCGVVTTVVSCLRANTWRACWQERTLLHTVGQLLFESSKA